MPEQSSSSDSSQPVSSREQEAKLKLQELRELFHSRAWLLCQELSSLYQWYGEAMDRATNHDDMVRMQASRRLLKHLFGGHLEVSAITPYQSVNTIGADYMARDAYSEEPTQ